MGFLATVTEFSDVLTSLQIRHAVGGSLASSAWSEPRHTNDADFIVELAAHQVDRLVNGVPDSYLIEPEEIRAVVANPSPFCMFQAIHIPTSFKIDCFVAHSEWEVLQLSRASLQEVFPGRTILYASPEDMVIAKCRWFDLGNRVSDRQWHDLVRLYEVQCENLERPYIEKWLAHFGLLDLWEEIQKQSTVDTG